MKLMRFACSVLLVLLSVHLGSSAEPLREISFTEDVEPLFRRHCIRCHSDANEEGGLSLQRPNAVIAAVADSDETIVAPSEPDSSLLIARLTDPDAGDLMPLDGEPLTQDEIVTLRSWIASGAAWDESQSAGAHWAYQSVVRPEVPQVTPVDPPIDQFVLRRLASTGFQLGEEAERARLIRRVSLALTGVPPTPEQVKAFVRDSSEDAYEQVVDELLQSARYGERWAVPWLDLARYADSNGFQADQIRDNWAYRDWVIRAFNDDMPFDQFVIDQLAGDLHDNPTVDQRVATGFHRMTTCNVEAGVHPEANRVNQVVDRVNTTATVFLGTTMECAQCHDHKYDPFSQQDYYRLFAYFNNTPLEVKNTAGVTWDFYGPTMDLPLSKSDSERRKELSAKLKVLNKQREAVMEEAGDGFELWLTGLRKQGEIEWVGVRPDEFESTGDESFEVLEDGAVLLSGSVPDTVDHIFTFDGFDAPITAIRLDALTDDSIPGKGPGRGDAKRTNIILNEFTLEAMGDDQRWRSVKLSDARADFSQKSWNVAGAIDGKPKTGWAISPQFGKPHWASFVLVDPVTVTRGQGKIRVTLTQRFGRGRVIGKPKISFYSGDASYLGVDAKYRKLAVRKKLNEAQREQLQTEYAKHNPAIVEIDRQIGSVQEQLQSVTPDTTLVMQELESPRETFVMVRGDYESLASKVQPGTPAILTGDGDDQSGESNASVDSSRMELARWLTSRENPLLARVTINRWWAQFFGTGLVSTPEDFGTQGDAPSHPELLDWLACELMDNGWSMKHVHKQIVMSRTFRQSAVATDDSLKVDPDNRLFTRGPRFRLPAELVRDNALAISGLLSDKMYGIPTMPFQPENIWRSVGRNQPKWKAAESEDRFRRGIYVVWKRAAPYPSFINFDAPNRGSCTVSRGRSNTPLQALTLLNDPAYAEMALALADRILADAPSTDDRSMLAYGMRLAVSRDATQRELEILQRLLDHERQQLRLHPEWVEQRTKVPFEEMNLATENREELAAWFAIANALLNLDETMNL